MFLFNFQPSINAVSKLASTGVRKAKSLREPKKLSSKIETKTSHISIKLAIGNKVSFTYLNQIATGTLRYVGITNFSGGQWCGIELEEPKGKNNGSVKGTSYFKCKDKHGLFLPVDKVKVAYGNENLVESTKIGKVVSKRLRESAKIPKRARQEEKPPSKAMVKRYKVDELSEDTKGSNAKMKTIVTKQISLNDSVVPLTVKIAEGLEEENNNNNNTIYHPKRLNDAPGVIVFVTGHRSISPVTKYRSCPLLTTVHTPSAEKINSSDHELSRPRALPCGFNHDGSHGYSSNEDSENPDSKKRDLPSVYDNIPLRLRKRESFSGIERKIRIRSPLRRALSLNIEFPKERHSSVSEDEEIASYLTPLKRSISDLTLYRRSPVRSPKGRFPRILPLSRTPWLRREQTAPELLQTNLQSFVSVESLPEELENSNVVSDKKDKMKNSTTDGETAESSNEPKAGKFVNKRAGSSLPVFVKSPLASQEKPKSSAAQPRKMQKSNIKKLQASSEVKTSTSKPCQRTNGKQRLNSQSEVKYAPQGKSAVKSSVSRTGQVVSEPKAIPSTNTSGLSESAPSVKPASRYQQKLNSKTKLPSLDAGDDPESPYLCRKVSDIVATFEKSVDVKPSTSQKAKKEVTGKNFVLNCFDWSMQQKTGLTVSISFAYIWCLLMA